MRYKLTFVQIIPVLFLILVIALGGCADRLRFAPSESQKQIALDTHLIARAVKSEGTEPGSEAAGRLVDGTAAALTYIGAPAEPNIADYPAALGQAKKAARARPSPDDVLQTAAGGLSLAAQIAAALGLGGIAVGGKRIVDWALLAKQRTTALREVIAGNELLKGKLAPDQQKQFTAAQKARQSPATERLIAAERVEAKRQIEINSIG